MQVSSKKVLVAFAALLAMATGTASAKDSLVVTATNAVGSPVIVNNGQVEAVRIPGGGDKAKLAVRQGFEFFETRF